MQEVVGAVDHRGFEHQQCGGHQQQCTGGTLCACIRSYGCSRLDNDFWCSVPQPNDRECKQAQDRDGGCCRAQGRAAKKYAHAVRACRHRKACQPVWRCRAQRNGLAINLSPPARKIKHFVDEFKSNRRVDARLVVEWIAILYRCGCAGWQAGKALRFFAVHQCVGYAVVCGQFTHQSRQKFAFG